MSMPEAPRSVCLLRLSALGDATHVLPMLRSLQRHRPDMAITWIIGRAEAALLKGLEGVEFVLVGSVRLRRGDGRGGQR